MEANAGVRLQEEAAKLLSDIRDGCRTSQKAINTLVTGMNNIVKTYVDVLKENLNQALKSRDGYLSLDQVHTVLNIFQEQSIFEGIEKPAQVDSYLRETSGGEKVLLRQLVVEHRVKLVKGISRLVPFKFGYIVPFKFQLEQALNCKDILDCIDNPIPYQKGVYQTVTHGLYYRYHPLVKLHGPTVLAIIIHVDDAEPCKALKSKAGKNNLRLFYWTIGNIHPKKRSTLRAIFLLAIAKAKVCKEKGNEFLLADFVEVMKELGTVGIELCINGKLRRFYAILIFATCDNPAAANLGKFKETHFALRPCRTCMIKSSELCDHFREDPALLRIKEDYEEQVQLVVGKKMLSNVVEVINIHQEDSDEDSIEGSERNVYADHVNPSVNYGINGKSILSEIPNFDLTKCLPHDILHVLNEGVVELVCRLLLKDLCIPPAPRVKPLVQLSELNHFIDSLCDLGHMSVSKPSEIEKGHITGEKLKQSAAQMMVLMRLLPFIMFNRCPDRKLQLLLKLIKLFDLCMSYVMYDSDHKKLGDMIADFLKAFRELYPHIKGLKLHFLLHLVTQCKLFGPLRQQWCCHFERMHSLFTNIFSAARSFKNPPLTAAIRHLASRNAELIEGKDGNYLTETDEVTGLKEVCITDLPEKECLSAKFPGLGNVTQVHQIHHRGSSWHEAVIMLLGGEVFGRIQAVYMVEDTVFFTYNLLRTEYAPSYNAYQILKCEQEFNIISFDELEHKFPMWRISFKFPKALKSFIVVQNPINS